MKTIQRIVTLALMAGISYGQPANEPVTKIFRLQHIGAEPAAWAVTMPTRDVKRLDALGVVVVTTSAADMTRVEAVLKELDQPRGRVEPGRVTVEADVVLTMYLVLASDRPVVSTLRVPALDPLMAGLKEVSGRAHTVVLETLVLRTQGNESGISGPLPSFRFADQKEGERVVKGGYEIGFRRVNAVQQAGKRLVVLERMSLQGTMSDATSDALQRFGFSSSVQVPEGQMVVLGKSTASPGGQSMFLVAMAKVL